MHGKIDWNINKNNEVLFKYSYADTGLYFNEIRSDNQSNFDPLTGEISRYLYTNGPDGEDTKQGFVQLRGIHNFDTGPIHNEFNEGIDFYDAHQTEASEYYSGNFTNFNLLAPVYGQLPVGPFMQFPYGSNDMTLDAKIRELGVFAQESATFGRLTLSGGGRYTELYSYQSYYGNVNDNNTVHLFLPSAAALYKITDTVSAFADYSQSIHPNIVAQNTPGLVVVGPVQAETGEGYEGGLKSLFLNGKILTQVSFFDITKNNVATQYSPPGADYTDESFVQKQRSTGVSFSTLGSITPHFDVNLTFNHQNVVVVSDFAQNMDTGNQVINAPQNTYSVLLSYHFLEGYLNHLTLTAQVFGSSANAVDVQNSFFLPSYTIVNLGASYTIDRGPKFPITTISLKCNNVGNAVYYPATGSKTNWITVGEPRNFLLDLNMSM